MTDPLVQALADKDPAAVGYLLGWRTVNHLPQPLVTAVFNMAADIACDGGKGMDQLRRNLSRVVGADNVTRELIRQSVRSYMRYWAEAFRLPSMAGDSALHQRLDRVVSGREGLEESHRRGKGVVVTMPHTGNWDMAGLWLAKSFGGFTTVAERLRPEVLYREFLAFRQSLGFTVLPSSGGPKPYPVLKGVLEDGGIVCLMGERDLKGTGLVVDFFGEPARFPPGPAKLAAETGAALHVAHTWFTPDGWGLSISGDLRKEGVADTSSASTAATVQQLTGMIADRFAANIAAHPTDWHMLQPVFTADIAARNASRQAAGKDGKR